MPHTFKTTISKSVFRLALLLIGLLYILLPRGGVWAQAMLQPGVYQMNGEATCRLSLLPDRSWHLYLWQGAEPGGYTHGYALLSRLVSDATGRRLAGVWLAAPDSCCPGTGRLELEVTGPDQFRVLAFLPSAPGGDWNVLPQADFKRLQDLPPVDRLKILADGWSFSMWYTGLLPDDQPADPEQGDFWVQVQEKDAFGAFSAWPGRFGVEVPDTGNLVLRYQDEEADFKMTAELKPQAGGLAYSGKFSTTLGEGRLNLVRAGLPAMPAGASVGELAGSLSGTWVDSRTGADFFKITGGEKGFEFTAYGGSLDTPRYLSQGRALPAGPGRYEGQARDAKGHCCGNQGRLVFRQTGKDTLEVSSVWWPQSAADPGTPPAQPYLLKRIDQDGGAAKPEASGWPYIQPPRTELLNDGQGSIKVKFNFIPADPGKVHTLFNHGGYMAELELFIDSNGKLAASLRSDQGMITLTGSEPVSTGHSHEAWLIFRSGSRAGIFLDGKLQAEAEMPGSWPGSRAPMTVGGSRWPGRNFSGSITSVELFAKAQDINAPGEADLAIQPPAVKNQALDSLAGGKSDTVELTAYWHPSRLSHAYAAGPDQAAALESQGFVSQGAVCRLMRMQNTGTKPLYLYRHSQKGHYLLVMGEKNIKGYERELLLGYMWDEATPQTTEFYGLQADFKDPLRGNQPQDHYYTTTRENLSLAQEAGYSQAVLMGYVLPAKEGRFVAPLLYTWTGSWRGEGWGKFFMGRKGSWLLVFWYYGPINGPHYYGRYKLSPDGRQAVGYAIGRSGKEATFYRQILNFDSTSDKGPSILVESHRVAAPLDDGRLVLFKKPAVTRPQLYKTGQFIPVEEAELLKKRFIQSDFDPESILQERIKSLSAEGRVVER